VIVQVGMFQSVWYVYLVYILIVIVNHAPMYAR
jgi:hypothetical protein